MPSRNVVVDMGLLFGRSPNIIPPDAPISLLFAAHSVHIVACVRLGHDRTAECRAVSFARTLLMAPPSSARTRGGLMAGPERPMLPRERSVYSAIVDRPPL